MGFTVVVLKRARAWYAVALGFELQFEFEPPGEFVSMVTDCVTRAETGPSDTVS
jgi:hypothetical protein